MKKWLNRVAIGCVSLPAFFVIMGIALHYIAGPSDNTLRLAAAGTTHVVVRSGGISVRKEKQKIWFELHEPKAIQELIDNIRIIDPVDKHTSAGNGNTTFDFYKGTELITSVGLCYRYYIQMPLWFGVGTLTDASRQYLLALLKSHGVPEDDH